MEGDGAGERIARDRGGSQNFGEAASAGAAPKVDLEEPVLRRDVTLGEEEVVDGGGVNMRDTPAVAQDFHLAIEAGDVDRRGGRSKGKEDRQGVTHGRVFR